MAAEGIRVEARDDVSLVVLCRGKGNALDAAYLRAISSTLDEVAAADPRGLILTGEGGAFCAGLDLVALQGADRATMEDLLAALYEACRALFAFRRPAAVALNGHAIAGGALLALCGDLRLMAQGDGRFGLNESALGIPMPAHTIPIVRYSLAPRIAEKLLYGGGIYPAYKVHDMGVLDELIEGARLIDRAVEMIGEWTPHRAAFADIKARLKAEAIAAMDEARAEDPVWLDHWFGDDAQRALADVAQKLQQK